MFDAAALVLSMRGRLMRRPLLVMFGVCFWIALLAAIVTTIARLGAEAKERRAQSVAAQHSKTR
jgi:hypothetical protein